MLSRLTVFFNRFTRVRQHRSLIMAPNMKPDTDSSMWRNWDLSSDHKVEIFTGDIQKSPNDDRDYRIIRLHNKLEAVLVHDRTTDKAAAALDVAVGHLSDPDDMPGLAHFCEHLLFMGTEQYPKENDYSEFINMNGGSSNAYTGASNTNYHFSVGPQHLDGALSRFASFFHSPLFKASCTLRELNAVDSENKKNKLQDGWRLFQLGKGLSVKDHPWTKFGSGNRETLLAAGRSAAAALKKKNSLSPNAAIELLESHDTAIPSGGSTSPSPTPSPESEEDGGPAGQETRRRLIDWWGKEYCGGRMKLAVLGNETLDQLTTMVASLFTPILNRGLNPLTLIETPPLGKEQQGTVVFAKTVMDMHILEVAFSIPYQYPDYRAKPADFLGHMLGHEGPGSLHSYLKTKGWLVSLEAGASPLGRGFDAFRVTFTLTPQGLENWRHVLVALYKDISMLKSLTFHPYHYEEMKALANIRFRFREKRRPDQYVTTLSESFQREYPRDCLLSAPSLLWDWKESDVRHLLDQLNVNSGRVMIMARDLSGIVDSTEWLQEKWYGTEHVIQRLDDKLISEALSPNNIDDLYIPEKNPFIPNDLDVSVLAGLEPSKRPSKIQETALTTLWFKKDDQFWVPKANIVIDVKSPLVSISPLNSVLTRLGMDLVVDSLTEYAYSAELAGLQYAVSDHPNGIQILVSGYHDKIHILLEKVLNTVAHLQVKTSRLEVMKEQLALEYRNFNLEAPFRMADYWNKYLLNDKGWTKEERLLEIPGVNASKVDNFMKELLSRSHLELLVHGNITKEQSLQLTTTVENILNTVPLSLDERPVDRSLVLPSGSNNAWSIDVPNVDEVNSSISFYCHVGDVADPKLRALLSLFAHIAHEPCFDQLRTKEQLGYLVFSSVWHIATTMGWRILVQSERQPSYLESRIEHFLNSFQQKLASMTEQDFARQKEGLIALKLEKTKNLREEMNRFWTHIQSGYHDFLRRETDVANLRKITLKEVSVFFSTYISPHSATRSKLSIHCKTQRLTALKFTVEAAEAFSQDLRAAGVEVDEEQFVKLAAKEPPVEAVAIHWKSMFESRPDMKEAEKLRLLMLLQQHAQSFAPETRTEDSADRIATLPSFIVDPIAFKHSMSLSPAAVPVEDYQDISISKL